MFQWKSHEEDNMNHYKKKKKKKKKKKEKEKERRSFYWHFLTTSKLVLNIKKTHLNVYFWHNVYLGNPSVSRKLFPGT
jgi:hypothetical protein